MRCDVKTRDRGQSWARLSHGSGITAHHCHESQSEDDGFICLPRGGVFGETWNSQKLLNDWHDGRQEYMEESCRFLSSKTH